MISVIWGEKWNKKILIFLQYDEIFTITVEWSKFHFTHFHQPSFPPTTKKMRWFTFHLQQNEDQGQILIPVFSIYYTIFTFSFVVYILDKFFVLYYYYNYWQILYYIRLESDVELKYITMDWKMYIMLLAYKSSYETCRMTKSRFMEKDSMR